MPPDLDLTPITNGWQALAALGSTLIVAAFGVLAQRAKAVADKKVESDREVAREVKEHVERVPELLGTVKYLTAQLEIHAEVSEKVQRRLADVELRLSRTDLYHEWLNSNMPRPPFLTMDEFFAKRDPGEL